MCKLFAYINHETKVIPTYLGTKIDRALRQLFYINSYGQVDGSGLMWMDKDGDTDFIKAPLPSPTFMECKAFDSIKDKLHKNKFVAGHTRYSTVGSNSWENSHPFEYGNFMGIQNGTISNSHKTLVQGKTSPCNVDSASVFWAFNEQGVDQTLANYEGERVFMYLNKEEKSFNVVKNDYRTLHITRIIGHDIYLLATDKFALELVAERSGLQIEDVENVPDDKLITFGIDNTFTNRDLEVPGPTFNLGNYSSNYGNGYNNNFSGNKGLIGNKAGKPPVNITKKPESSSVNSSSLSTSGVVVVDKEENYYVQDCDICMSPIFTDDVAYGDDQDLMRTDDLCCQHCKDDLKNLRGYQPVLVTMKGVF